MFNLATLLGLAAVVAGWIGFHRRVVVLSGVPAVCLLTAATVVALAAGVLLPYGAVLGCAAEPTRTSAGDGADLASCGTAASGSRPPELSPGWPGLSAWPCAVSRSRVASTRL